LTLVQADLLDEDSVERAIAGSTHVAHVASPFIIGEPKDENDLIRPAVEGTLSVLRACRRNKVKRVVITSSIAAIENVHPDKEPKDNYFSEENWSDPDRPAGMSAYAKSKVLAERAAWDYVAKLPEDEKIELTVINPGFVVGPSFIGGDFSSGKVISDIMMNKFPGIPKISFPTVDVRDVA
jgi:nucleoside-diphosphate-sugar epimerase